MGDPMRSLRISGDYFSGAHTNNPHYFSREEEGILRLKTVCWLHISAQMDVSEPGRYEVVIFLRLSRKPDYAGDWRVGAADARDQATFLSTTIQRDWPRSQVDEGIGPLHMRNYNGYGKGGKFLQSLPLHHMCSVSFGVVTVRRGQSVRFSMGGGCSTWCGGLSFGGMEVRRIGVPYANSRLFFVAKRRRETEERTSALSRLPPHVIRSVLDWV
jgi:hypothetical protein